MSGHNPILYRVFHSFPLANFKCVQTSGYKSKLSVPKEIRRRFSRLAGLLEIADNEFAQLRETLMNYEKDMLERINRDPESVSIDLISLKVFMNNSAKVKELDKIVAHASNRPLDNQEYDLNLLVRIVDYVGLRNIADINLYFNEYANKLPQFAKEYPEKLIASGWVFTGEVKTGTSIMYLSHLLISTEQSKQKIKKYLKVAFSFTNQSAEFFSQAILAAYKGIAPATKKRKPTTPSKKANTKS